MLNCFANIQQPNGRNKGFLFHGALDELRDLELHIKNQPLGIPDVYREKLQVEADRFDKKMESKPLKLFTSVRTSLIMVRV